MLIRESEPGDLSALRALYLQARTQAFTWQDTSTFAPGDFDAHTAGEVVWVAVGADTRVAGFLSAWMPEHFVHNLFVSPAASGRGIGSALLAHCLPLIGVPARLKCASPNVRAERFYRARGWRVVALGEGGDGPYHVMEYDVRARTCDG